MIFMRKYDKENLLLFDNWTEIMDKRRIRELRQRKVKLKKRMKSKRKRKDWYKNNCS